MTLPISHKDAISCNSKFYHTGKICKNGHIADRLTKSRQCVECKIKWRKSNKSQSNLKEYYNEYKERSFIAKMWSNAKARAAKKNKPFTITAKDIQDIWPTDNFCPVLRIPLIRNIGSRKASDNSPSLDCIVPATGYIPTNIAVISTKANALKRDETNPEK